MSTLTVEISDQALERLESFARVHGCSVEQEVSVTIEQAVQDERLIEFLHNNPDELQRQIGTHHEKLAARKVYFTEAEVEAAIQEGRE